MKEKNVQVQEVRIRTDVKRMRSCCCVNKPRVHIRMLLPQIELRHVALIGWTYCNIKKAIGCC